METVKTKNNLQLAVGIFGRTIIAAIIAVFLYLSLTVVLSELSTEPIGFTLWEYDEAGQAHEVRTYLETDEDYDPDMKLAENQTATEVRSDMPAAVSLAGDILTQVASLIILAAFPYKYLWEQGNHDRNEINFGHKQDDKWRGLKIGLLADIPAILVYLALWLGKLGVSVLSNAHAVYTIFNSSFMPFCYAVMGRDLTSAAALPVWKMLVLLLPVLVLPAVCWVAYTLGQKQFVLSDKVFYKKKKKKAK